MSILCYTNTKEQQSQQLKDLGLKIIFLLISIL